MQRRLAVAANKINPVRPPEQPPSAAVQHATRMKNINAGAVKLKQQPSSNPNPAQPPLTLLSNAKPQAPLVPAQVTLTTLTTASPAVSAQPQPAVKVSAGRLQEFNSFADGLLEQYKTISGGKLPEVIRKGAEIQVNDTPPWQMRINGNNNEVFVPKKDIELAEKIMTAAVMAAKNKGEKTINIHMDDPKMIEIAQKVVTEAGLTPDLSELSQNTLNQQKRSNTQGWK